MTPRRCDRPGPLQPQVPRLHRRMRSPTLLASQDVMWGFAAARNGEPTLHGQKGTIQQLEHRPRGAW